MHTRIKQVDVMNHNNEFGVDLTEADFHKQFPPVFWKKFLVEIELQEIKESRF